MGERLIDNLRGEHLSKFSSIVTLMAHGTESADNQNRIFL